MPAEARPPPDLETYRPPLTKTSGFERFWKENTKVADEQPLNVEWKVLDAMFTKKIKLSRIFIDGFIDRSPIRCVYATDARETGKRPVFINFHDYAYYKGHITDLLGWISLGFSVMTIDLRGQSGESADYQRYAPGYVKGHMTKGIKSESTYYYRFVLMDCYRAVNCIAEREEIDADKIAVMGVGQGGGLALSIAALNKKVKTVMSGFPLLCNMAEAARHPSQGPYLEILDYLRYQYQDQDTVFETLSYFDAMNFAPLIRVPALITAGLEDAISPISAIFATYNRIAAREKELTKYPGVGHEDSSNSVDRRMRWGVAQFDR